MTLNMEDDLDMSLRAPYISMSESSELPMLIAEDLMWGAQPDLKQTLNFNKKLELNVNNNQLAEQENTADSQMKSYQQQKSTMESSLASLLCSQLLQHHQQQIHEQQMNQTEKQIILNQHPEVKIKILNQDGNLTIVNPKTATTQSQETRMGS